MIRGCRYTEKVSECRLKAQGYGKGRLVGIARPLVSTSYFVIVGCMGPSKPNLKLVVMAAELLQHLLIGL